MSDVIPPSRARRARIYFRMMDICLVFAAIGLVDHLLDDLFDWTLLPKDSAAYFAIAIIVLFFNFIAPPILIAARFMRDEYAEQLWQRSVAVLAYAIALVPLLMTMAFFYVYLTNPGSHTVGPFASLFGEVEGGQLVGRFWMAFLLLWVTIFQFLRWRDTR